ncbi:DUF2213 domain-containing protein [Acinetobacter lactucae]|nr:DUF2213 domain-containing protein [Acinetobacter lactucae]
MYRLLRDPEELSKALFTFREVQFLLCHIPVTAEKPQKDFTVGVIGTESEEEVSVAQVDYRFNCFTGILHFEGYENKVNRLKLIKEI